MSVKAILFFVAALALFSFALSRPVLWSADLNSANVNGTANWSGVAAALITQGKGIINFRVRIVGAVNVTDDIVYVNVENMSGWTFASLKFSNTQNTFSGDFYLNLTGVEYFAQDQVWVKVGTKKGSPAVIGGAFSSGFLDGVAFLNGASEVPAVNSKFTGMARSSINYAAPAAWPVMLADSDKIFVNTQTFFGRVLHNISKNVTGAHLHGPAMKNQTAGILVTLTNNDYESHGSSPFEFSSNFSTAITKSMTYFNVHTGANPNGEIRGQNYELNSIKRRLKIVPTFNFTSGRYAGSLTSTLFLNSGRNALKPGTYISLTPTNGSFSAVLKFTLPVAAREWFTIRGFFLELNYAAVANQTWSFSWKNYATNVFDFGGSVNSNVLTRVFDWVDPSQAFNYYWTDFSVGTNTVEIQITSTGSNSLLVDLLALRINNPVANTMDAVKPWFKL